MSNASNGPRTLCDLFREAVANRSDDVAYRYKREGSWVDLTWAENGKTVDGLTRSLLALGLQRGERVSILSQTRPRWTQADTAIVNGGGVTVGIYPTNLGPECAYILEHSESRILFIENRDQLDKIEAERGNLRYLEHIILIEGDADGDAGRGVLGWNELMRLGEQVDESRLLERAAEIQPEDLASLVYTSGTTGTPKGVMLTHANLLFTTWSVGQCLIFKPQFITLLFLPLAHVFARLIVSMCQRENICVAFAESITKVGENLREVRPHFIASVPRIFEKVHEKITSGAEDAGGLKQKIFDWSLDVGYRVSRLKQQGRPVPLGLRLRNSVADKLVFSKIQAALGGRMMYAISGAAPLNKAIAEFFHACGVEILEGIGMTENTSFTNVNRLGANRFGTVGQVGPGIEMKLGADGEVLYHGANVMQGYFKEPKATAETIDADGWLYTGDIGEIDEDGYLKITDRKKDLIITAAGKNIAPQRVERAIRTSRYISQVVAYGDRKRYLTALITLDPDNMTEWARRNGFDGAAEQLAADPRVRELIEREVAAANEDLASYETIKKFHILPQDFSIESGELTPSLKVKRKVVCDRHRDLLEAMYVEATTA